MTRSGKASTIWPGVTADRPDYAVRIFSAIVIPMVKLSHSAAGVVTEGVNA